MRKFTETVIISAILFSFWAELGLAAVNVRLINVLGSLSDDPLVAFMVLATYSVPLNPILSVGAVTWLNGSPILTMVPVLASMPLHVAVVILTRKIMDALIRHFTKRQVQNQGYRLLFGLYKSYFLLALPVLWIVCPLAWAWLFIRGACRFYGLRPLQASLLLLVPLVVSAILFLPAWFLSGYFYHAP